MASSTSTRDFAQRLDLKTTLRDLRKEFVIPTKRSLKSKNLRSFDRSEEDADPCIYFCGNSLGLQPKRTSERIQEHLATWAQKGVLGHFWEHEDARLRPFLHVDDQAAEMMAPVVGAQKEEVAVMETLTANLHQMLTSFYRPTSERYKIILESKAFPSDHFAVESQLLRYGLDPKEAMVLIEPAANEKTVTIHQINRIITENAKRTALILLPGVQYYTGQLLEIKLITRHAHSKGIMIGWDLAHAVGNVELQLHQWEVDFAVWCTYKYLNSGPGSIAGLFVHEKHGKVDLEALRQGKNGYMQRLSGWWGSEKQSRFEMDNVFVPTPGAAGFQLGNPCALAVAALTASLEIFAEASMPLIVERSRELTQLLETLLLQEPQPGKIRPWTIITPRDPKRRGAQLSIQLEPGLLEPVMKGLEEAGVVVDERKPDVIRVAPAPLYNTCVEVWDFVDTLESVCTSVIKEQTKAGQGDS